MNFTLYVWRQANAKAEGKLVQYEAKNISPDASFLEMLDVVNEDLINRGEMPIAFEHDCREGICGSCGVMINGKAHGGFQMATCQVRMRQYPDGAELYIEPWRSRAFVIVRDLIVDRSPLDAIIQAGGFISVSTGSAPDANAIPVPKPVQEIAMDAAECIGCAACVAQCPNGAGQLFTAAKVAHLNHLPQGEPERFRRVEMMVETMEHYFGSCTNFRECEAVCPKGISIDFIAKLNRDYFASRFRGSRETGS